MFAVTVSQFLTRVCFSLLCICDVQQRVCKIRVTGNAVGYNCYHYSGLCVAASHIYSRLFSRARALLLLRLSMVA